MPLFKINLLRNNQLTEQSGYSGYESSQIVRESALVMLSRPDEEPEGALIMMKTKQPYYVMLGRLCCPTLLMK